MAGWEPGPAQRETGHRGCILGTQPISGQVGRPAFRHWENMQQAFGHLSWLLPWLSLGCRCAGASLSGCGGGRYAGGGQSSFKLLSSLTCPLPLN